MTDIYEFMKSDLGVAISWICTVVSTIITLIKTKENRSLKTRINQTTSTDASRDTVTQKGKGNIYTKNNSGDINIKM